jgi:preprotein translocase subunit SecA
MLTAKAGFDFLRDPRRGVRTWCSSPSTPSSWTDFILVDEARVPLVIAGTRISAWI